MRYNHFDLLPERAFRARFGRLETLEGGKGDAPAPPDYTSAALATAAGNLDAARVATKANRVNQVTPYGNLTYTQTGTDPDAGWTATQTLSPNQQQMLDANQGLGMGLLGTAQQGLGKVNDLLSNPTIDESKLAQMPISGQSVQDAVMSRLNPQIDRQREQLRTQLANQGIQQDSEAYKNAFTDQNQRENDLLTDASLRGINTGLTARQQGIQEQTYMQDRPLNVINALRTGNQVQNPNFVSVPQQQTTTGADLLGAAQANYNGQLGAYNANQAGNNAMMGGLFSLGSAFAGSPTGAASVASMFSDRRLKRNIKRIGTHRLGIGLYSFDYVWGEPSTGVMADEVQAVMPEAVGMQDGFHTVNYALLG